VSEELAAAARILARQQSTITTIQAASVGIGRERCQSLVRQAVWEHLDHGVYGPAGVPLTWRRRLMVALLVAPEGSLASHRATAALLGVGGMPSPAPEITIPRGSTFRRPWLIVHESKDLDLADRRRIDGIPTTGPRRLAMDLGSVVSPKRYRQTLRELRSQHGVDFDALLRTYLRHKRQGRNGGAALRDWLDRYVDTGGVAESGLEQVALDAFLDAGLRPVAQLWVEIDAGIRYRIDLAFPDRMIAVEIDGAHHEEKPTKAADRRRDAHLEALGWTVIHVEAKTFAIDLARALRKVLAASVVAQSAVG
jgi:very-short-patch-repair endonuclease